MTAKNKFIIGAIIVLIILVGLFAWGKKNQAGDLRTWNDTDIACLPNGHQNLALHIHQKLSITVFGEEQVIPANIGINNTCMAEVHTHDSSGEIHIESVDAGDKRTLGDFFAVWGEMFSQNQILDNVNGETGTVKLLVNGEPNTEFANYVMKDHDVIEISFEPTAVDY